MALPRLQRYLELVSAEHLQAFIEAAELPEEARADGEYVSGHDRNPGEQIITNFFYTSKLKSKGKMHQSIIYQTKILRLLTFYKSKLTYFDLLNTREF